MHPQHDTASPAPPTLIPREVDDMPAHALHSPTLPPNGYLPIGSVVPRTAPVLMFAADGTATGTLPQRVADEVTAEVDAMGVSWSPKPWPGPKSGNCGHRWSAEYGLSWMCTLPKDHSEDIRCEAQGVKGAVLASPTEALVTEALKPAPRKRTRTVRKAEVA